MPTFERLLRFNRDYDALSPADKTAFKLAIKKCVADLERGHGFRQGLRVKGVQGVQGSPGVFEMPWGDDGRATFSYGESVHEAEPHIIWRRVGRHDVIG